MSTAGKVLSVLIMLSSIGWMILTAGVAQLNRNGNQALLKLNNDIEKLQEDLKQTQFDIGKFRSESTVVQEETDRALEVIRDHQIEVEKAHSATRDILASVQFQMTVMEETLKNAQLDSEQRLADLEAEKKAKAAIEADVEVLKSENSALMNRLASLRDEFKSKLKANVSLLGQSASK
jgi:hypothetical protein